MLVEEARTNYVINSIGNGVGTDGLPSGRHSQHDGQVTASGTPSLSTRVEGYRQAVIDVSNAASSEEYYQVMLDVPVTDGARA